MEEEEIDSFHDLSTPQLCSIFPCTALLFFHAQFVYSRRGMYVYEKKEEIILHDSLGSSCFMFDSM